MFVLVAFSNFTTLVDAFRKQDGLNGIAVDHFQYLHSKALFPEDVYGVDFHASSPVTVGILLSSEDPSFPLFEGTPLQQCLYRQAVFGMWTLEDEIMAALNHSLEFLNEPTVHLTSANFFGKGFSLFLFIITTILAIILLIYGVIDEFLIRKDEGNRKDAIRGDAKLEDSNKKEGTIAKPMENSLNQSIQSK